MHTIIQACPSSHPLYKYGLSKNLGDIAAHTKLCNSKPLNSFPVLFALKIIMSDKCGNCDCTDKSQCVKQGSGYALDIVETEQSYVEAVVMEVPAAEHGGKCKCGPSCSCVNCTCGD